MAQKFNVGDLVVCKDRHASFPSLLLNAEYVILDLQTFSFGNQLVKVRVGDSDHFYAAKRFDLVRSAHPKLYFCNNNHTLMTEDEAMEYLRKNGGGTMYKKVLTMTIETKTEEKIERF